MDFRKTLKVSQWEAALFALMTATTENFILYYGVERKFSPLELAMLATLPMLLGAISQFLIPLLTKEKYLSESVIGTMIVQVVGAFGLFFVVHYALNFYIFIAFASLYFIGGMSSTPLWIDWAKWMIPTRHFKKYISKRSSFSWWIITIMYLSLAGVALVFPELPLKIIFFVGALARIISVCIQLWIVSGEHVKKRKNKELNKEQFVNLHDHIKEEKEKHELHVSDSMYSVFKNIIIIFIFFLGLFKLSVQVSGPFFIPYMRENLKLNLPMFIILTSLPYLGRAISLNMWGRHAYGFSSLKGVILCGFYISLIPIWWGFGLPFRYLLITEVFSGVFWGGLELYQVLFIQHFEKINMRAWLGGMMSFGSFTGVIGSAIGALLIENNWSIKQVFFISSLARLMPIIILFAILRRKYPKIISMETIKDYALNVINKYH